MAKHSSNKNWNSSYFLDTSIDVNGLIQTLSSWLDSFMYTTARSLFSHVYHRLVTFFICIAPPDHVFFFPYVYHRPITFFICIPPPDKNKIHAFHNFNGYCIVHLITSLWYTHILLTHPSVQKNTVSTSITEELIYQIAYRTIPSYFCDFLKNLDCFSVHVCIFSPHNK